MFGVNNEIDPSAIRKANPYRHGHMERNVMLKIL